MKFTKAKSLKHIVGICKHMQYIINVCYCLKPIWCATFTECSTPLLVSSAFYRAIKLGQLYGTNSVRRNCFSACYWCSGSVPLGWFILLYIQGALGFFLEILVFICDTERLWQRTLKLITLCLQQLLNSEKCLKQRDYRPRPYPSLSKEWKFFQTTSGELWPSLISLTYSTGSADRLNKHVIG